MVAHHIKERKLFPKEALKIENGITLCTKCHKKEPYQFWFLGDRLTSNKSPETIGLPAPVTELLSPREVTEILKVDTETMYRWLRKGVLPGIKIGGVWRVRIEDIELKPEKLEIK
jgi:excisionase family DNA binding protein